MPQPSLAGSNGYVGGCGTASFVHRVLERSMKEGVGLQVRAIVFAAVQDCEADLEHVATAPDRELRRISAGSMLRSNACGAPA